MRRTGFTLIEILVVIAVIAMLLGILMPALRAARQQAIAVVCGSNLKQLALGMALYEQDNETLPHGFDDSIFFTASSSASYPGIKTHDFGGKWWFYFLKNTTDKNFSESGILRCPARNIAEPLLKENILCGNYGVNRSICKDAPGITGIIDDEFVGTPLTLGQLRQPAQTLLLSDSGYSLMSWRGASNALGPVFHNPRREGAFYIPGMEINAQRLLDGTISNGFERDAVYGRHPGKTVNMAFADGHIVRGKADDLFVEKIGNSYLNRSPLWLPK